MKTASNKANKLQQVIDDVKQYQLSSVMADARQDEAYGTEKFMDKTMKELLHMARNDEVEGIPLKPSVG